jgi:hypothetical protein
MEAVRQRIVIGPSGVGEVLDLGFNLARRNYRLLLTTALWGIIPAGVLGALGNLVLNSAGFGAAGASGSGLGGATGAVAGGAFVLLTVIDRVVTALTYAALCIACARLISPGHEANELSAGSLYAAAFHAFGRLLLWGILIAVLAAPLTIVFPLGIFLLIRWFVSWNALLLEGRGPLAALARSWELSQGSWWHTCGVVLSTGLIVSLITWAFLGVLGGVAMLAGFAFGSPAFSAVITALLGMVSSAITEPFLIAIFTVLYFELRARAEGFDLEQRALLAASHP